MTVMTMIHYRKTFLSLGMLMISAFMFYQSVVYALAIDYSTACLYAALGLTTLGAATEPRFLLAPVSSLLNVPLGESKFAIVAYGLALAALVWWAIL
ncbi:hypothetical protein BH24PSE2_BH24PSE2_04390 [soil metagenome]